MAKLESNPPKITTITVQAARTMPDPLNPKHTMFFSVTLSKPAAEGNYRIDTFDLMGEANHLIDCYVGAVGAKDRKDMLQELKNELKI